MKSLIYVTLLFAVYLWFTASCSKGKSSETASNNMSAVQHDKAIIDSTPNMEAQKVTFIELGSVNCIPCKMMQPIMEEIEKEYGEQVKVVFHDVWTEEGRPYAEKYGIRSIPTQVFLDTQGSEYFRHVGFFPKEEIVKVLRQKGVE